MSEALIFGKETYRLAFPDRANPPYTHVSYGLPFTESLKRHVAGTFDSKRAYVIASASLSKHTNHVKDLEAALGDRHAGTWIGIRPHTPFDDLIPIINEMRAKKADLLITLGGGSLTDGAKIIVYALENGVETLDDIGHLLVQNKKDREAAGKHIRNKEDAGNAPKIPLIFIPTTLSAGEYTKFGGGTDPRTHLKTILTHPKMFASLVVLDPSLCITTPEWVWLSTGVRAIDHCCESACALDCPEEVEKTAEKSLALLIPNLLKTKADPENLEARLACQLAANYVTVVLLYMPDLLLAGGSHGIGHQLGPLGVGHGQTSCILLPAVMKYNKRVNGERQDRLKHIIWNSDPQVKDLLIKAGLVPESSDVGDVLDVIFRALGMPRSLKEVGVGRDKFDILANNSVKDSCCAVNPIPLDKPEQVKEILEMVVG